MESGGGGSNDGNKAPAAPEAQRTSSTTTAAATGGSAASAADGQAAAAAAAPDPVSIADGAGRLTGLTHLYYTRPGQARLREEGEEYLQQHPEVYRIMDYYTARALAERPTEGIAAWSAALFASPDLKEQVERHTAAMAAAATAAAGASGSEPDAKPPAGP